MLAKHVAFCLVMLTPFPAAQEIVRPTQDASWTSPGGDCGSNTMSMPYAYDAAGDSTASTLSVVGGRTTNKAYGRRFSGFAAASGRYASAVLVVHSVCTTSDLQTTTGGGCGLAYSLDGGKTIYGIRNYPMTILPAGWSEITDAISIPSSQDLRLINVYACVIGLSDDDGNPDTGLGPGAARTTIWDIRTVGTF